MTHAVRTFAATFLAFAALATPAHAADTGEGHFRMGDTRSTFTHAAAVRVERRPDPADDHVYVYLSDRPLDAAVLAADFDPDDTASEAHGDRSGAFVRLCITADGDECGLFYRQFAPGDSFNTSGYGTFALSTRDDARIAGHWTLAKPEEFFGKSYDFDLRFDVAIATSPGQPLPEGGGDAGAAYRAYAAAIARGDLDALRASMGEDARWRLPADDPAQARETLKSMRDGQPVDPEIVRGRRNGDTVVLWVQGRDRDELMRGGRVRMTRHGKTWEVVEQDLGDVEE